MSETGAVIDVVGSDHRTYELLEEIVFFVGGPGRRKAGDAVGSGGLLDGRKLLGNIPVGFIPGGRFQFPVFAIRGF
jgi:hypothetical protein